MPYNLPMSDAITFDTHATIKKLVESGMPEKQAEAVVSVQVELVNSNLATKQDIAELRAATQQDIAELRAATQQDIAELRAATKQDIAELRAATKQDIAMVESRLIKWVTGFGLAIIGLVVTSMLN